MAWETREEICFKEVKIKKNYVGGPLVSNSLRDKIFFEQMRIKKVAVIGAGDTANCVMEYLLPIVYPNYYYGFYHKEQFLPSKVFWIGQKKNRYRIISFQINPGTAIPGSN